MNEREILVTERDCNTLEKRIGLLTGGIDCDAWPTIRHLHEELHHARVLHDEPVPEDVVTMNSSVLLEDLNAGRQQLCTLVYPGSSGVGRISVLSSLGTALLGARVGDVLVYEGHDGPARVRVQDIVYQPEAAGNQYL